MEENYFSAFESPEETESKEKYSGVKLAEDDEEALVQNALQEWIDYTMLIRGKLDQSLENWQTYLQTFTSGGDIQDGAAEDASAYANINTGELSSIIDGLHAQLCLSAFPDDASFKKAKSRSKISKRFEQDYERLTQETAQKLNTLENAYLDIKRQLLDGPTAVWHPFIRIECKKPMYSAGIVDTDEIKSLSDYSGLIGSDGISKTYKDVVQVEGTGFIPLAIEDWRVDPTATDINKTPFLWKRWVYPQDLEDIEEFKNTDNLVSYRDQMTDDTTSYTDEKYNYSGITQDNTSYKSHLLEAGESPDNYPDGMVCLFERWGDFRVNGKLYRNHVLVYSNDKTFHYFGPNPYDHGMKPFTVSSLIPVPDTLYGKTSITDAIPLTNTLNSLFNQALDTLSFNAIGVNSYNTNDAVLAEWVRQKKTLSPGDFVPRSQPDSLTPMPVNTQGLSIIDALVGRTREMISQVSGGVPYATGGTQSAQDRTLGEVEILAAGTNSRFQAILQNYEKHRLKPFVTQEFENFRQFMTEPVAISEDGDKISPEIVKLLDYEFQITGSRTVLNKSRSLQDKQAALAMIPQFIQGGIATLKQSGKQIDPMSILEELFKDLNLNVDSIISDVELNATMGAPNGPETVLPNELTAAQGAMGIPTGGASLPPIA